MKKISFIILAFMAIFSAGAQHRSTFDSLGLSPDSYWNGSNLSGGFLDGDTYFTNSYDTTYGSWSGFAYSNVPLNVDTITTGSGDYNYQYSSAPGAGVFGSSAFGVCYAGSTPTARLEGFAKGHEVYGMYVTNSAYTYLSMKYGDGFAKKFGGVTGRDSDWFRLTVSGWYQGNLIPDSVTFYLADFRSPDTTQHYILNTWKFVNLLPLGNVDSLFFTLASDDTAGGFGMNTPAYFDLDNFMTTDGVTYSGPRLATDSFFLEYADTLTGNADTLIANIVAKDSLSPFLRNTVSLVSSPLVIGAYAYLDSVDSLVYIPAAGIQGTDTLYYSVCDEVGSCDTAQILIYLQGPNDTGIPDIATSDLHVYPDPASSFVTVSYTSEIESVEIIDMSGRQALQADVNRNSTSLNVSTLSPGVYTVMIHTADGTAVKRIVKE